MSNPKQRTEIDLLMCLLTVEGYAIRGAAFTRGLICAPGHVVPAVPDASACRLGLQGIENNGGTYSSSSLGGWIVTRSGKGVIGPTFALRIPVKHDLHLDTKHTLLPEKAIKKTPSQTGAQEW
ncbi:hypothetical protein OIU78_029670 [Salix suchowensis]|nr:hypothetical protein OIU78_029670 [Salix suchowensis]